MPGDYDAVKCPFGLDSTFSRHLVAVAYLSMRDKTSMPAGSKVGTSSARLRAGHFGNVSL